MGYCPWNYRELVGIIIRSWVQLFVIRYPLFVNCYWLLVIGYTNND